MKAHYTQPSDCIDDIKRKFIKHPHFQSRVRTSPSQVVGNAEISFYRGRHAGVHDAYLTIKKKYPDAAKALLRAYGMDEEGHIAL